MSNKRGLRRLIHSPEQAAQAYLEWVDRPPERCVICGGKTRTQFWNNGGHLNYVHNYHEPGYLGCKEVWRYKQDKTKKLDYDRWREDNWREIAAGDTVLEDYDFEFNFLSSRDEFHDYKSYMASIEWEIKATSAKQRAHWTCGMCGFVGTKSTLDAHHNDYTRLYHEQYQDIDVLCKDCHRAEHKKNGRYK